MNAADRHSDSLRAFRRYAGIVALIGLPLVCLAVALRPEDGFRAYLFGYFFWASISIGSLGLLLLHQLTGGNWGHAIRPGLMSAAMLLPLAALLFIPICIGAGWIYEWADPEIVKNDLTLQHKAIYLNLPSVIVRAAGSFLIWILAFWIIRKRVVQRDMTRRRTGPAAVGVILFILTMTFCAIDWIMSLEPHWHSPIFGILVIAGQALLAMAMAIAFSYSRLASDGVRNRFSEATGDVGNLLLTLLMFWGYLAFSQYLIIWSGNLPEGISYYVRRREPGWLTISWLLIIAHFFIPFLLLLNRNVKSNLRRLATVAAGLILMRLMDVVWLVIPSYEHNKPVTFAFSALAFVALGALWLFAYAIVLDRDRRQGIWTTQEGAI